MNALESGAWPGNNIGNRSLNFSLCFFRIDDDKLGFTWI